MYCCVVIPAYQPGDSLISYVKALRAAETGPVIIVDDGSDHSYCSIFDELANMEGCTVLRHPANKGKGAALRTAISYYLEERDAAFHGCIGIITADCDGQHAVEDVCRVAEAMDQNPESLVLGCRDFGEGTPRRSATGNRLTSWAMHALYNIELQDTQTGLRGLANNLLEGALKLKGNRYEYELNMLLWAKQKGVPFHIVPIRTIYFDNNSGSHYRTVRDSLRIIGQLLRGLAQYGLSSLLSALVDITSYAVLVKLLFSALPLASRMFFGSVLARIISSVVNYACNRQLPYMRNKRLSTTVVRYYILWFFQLIASYLFSLLLCSGLGLDELTAKYLVDILLAIASYQVQLRWVFHTGDD